MNSSYNQERTHLITCIQDVANDNDFWDVAKKIYTFQSKYNVVFKKFVGNLYEHKDDLPFLFLPITFFKTELVKTGFWKAEKLFLSSGTTGQIPSKHYVSSSQDYHDNARSIFQKHFGSVSDYCFLCLLPSYLERGSSSLVDMCAYFISSSKVGESGFYLSDYESLKVNLLKNEEKEIPTILIGVSYALLDFAEQYEFSQLSHIKIMKTGGMKGRRKESHPEELDEKLKERLGVYEIHAEYGMTECMSQLYGDEAGYLLNDRMKTIITDLSDPFQMVENGKSGRINIVDIGNIDTCAFIATDDVGYIDDQGLLQILGRIDHSDLRGCNLLL